MKELYEAGLSPRGNNLNRGQKILWVSFNEKIEKILLHLQCSSKKENYFFKKKGIKGDSSLTVRNRRAY